MPTYGWEDIVGGVLLKSLWNRKWNKVLIVAVRTPTPRDFNSLPVYDLIVKIFMYRTSTESVAAFVKGYNFSEEENQQNGFQAAVFVFL